MIDKENIKKYRELKALVEQARKILIQVDGIEFEDKTML